MESSSSPHIRGMPFGSKVVLSGLRAMLARGAYRMEATPGYRDGVMELACHPVMGGEPYVMRPRTGKVSYRDAGRTSLEVVGPGEDTSMTFARPDDEVLEEVGTVEGREPIYRGMCHEEFQHLLQVGEIWSHGRWNMDGQDGLTYWSTDPCQARSYATSFAPMHCRPVFGFPGYVVAAERPLETRRVSGTGKDEVGVARPILSQEVVAVWRGDVIDYDPGSISLVRDRDGEWRTGSMVQPTSRVAWTEIRGQELDLLLGREPTLMWKPGM